MFDQKSERDDRPLTERRWGADVRRLQRAANDERLRKALPFAAAFAAGFLLAVRRRGDSSDARQTAEEDALVSAANQVRQRLTASGTGIENSAAGGGKTSIENSAAGGGGTGRERTSRLPDTDPDRSGGLDRSEPASTEAVVANTDEKVAALSPPTASGMPMLGVCTPQDAEYDEYLDGVREAFEIGYRHVDATERRESYYNEAAVGDAIESVDLPREDLFVTTKVDSEDLTSDSIRRSTEESLDHFDLDYVDLLYVHWPTDEYDPEATLEAFAELRDEGLVREIGVGNFTVELLEEAVEVSPVPIFANQVEMHPLLPQTELQQFCARDDVDVELVAYAPTAQGRVEEVDEIRAVADKHDATPEQVSLAWLREKGVTVLPEATDPAHLRENWLSLDIDLDPEDVEKIDGIDRRVRLVDPDEAPWN